MVGTIKIVLAGQLKMCQKKLTEVSENREFFENSQKTLILAEGNRIKFGSGKEAI